MNNKLDHDIILVPMIILQHSIHQYFLLVIWKGRQRLKGMTYMLDLWTHLNRK